MNPVSLPVVRQGGLTDRKEMKSRYYISFVNITVKCLCYIIKNRIFDLIIDWLNIFMLLIRLLKCKNLCLLLNLTNKRIRMI